MNLFVLVKYIPSLFSDSNSLCSTGIDHSSFTLFFSLKLKSIVRAPLAFLTIYSPFQSSLVDYPNLLKFKHTFLESQTFCTRFDLTPRYVIISIFFFEVITISSYFLFIHYFQFLILSYIIDSPFTLSSY